MLTTSVASPTDSAVMIEASTGCTCAGSWGSSRIRIWTTFCLAARTASIACATSAWTRPVTWSTIAVIASTSWSTCAPASVSALRCGDRLQARAGAAGHPARRPRCGGRLRAGDLQLARDGASVVAPSGALHALDGLRGLDDALLNASCGG